MCHRVLLFEPIFLALEPSYNVHGPPSLSLVTFSVAAAIFISSAVLSSGSYGDEHCYKD